MGEIEVRVNVSPRKCKTAHNEPLNDPRLVRPGRGGKTHKPPCSWLAGQRTTQPGVPHFEGDTSS